VNTRAPAGCPTFDGIQGSCTFADPKSCLSDPGQDVTSEMSPLPSPKLYLSGH